MAWAPPRPEPLRAQLTLGDSTTQFLNTCLGIRLADCSKTQEIQKGTLNLPVGTEVLRYHHPSLLLTFVPD